MEEAIFSKTYVAILELIKVIETGSNISQVAVPSVKVALLSIVIAQFSLVIFLAIQVSIFFPKSETQNRHY